MKQYLLFVFIFSIIYCSLNKDDKVPKSDRYLKKNNFLFLYDSIPDKYNTGHDKYTTFSTLDSDGYAGKVYIKIRKDDTQKKTLYILTSYSDNLNNLPNDTTISNYDFSDAGFVIYDPQRYNSSKIIRFINCKFRSFSNSRSAAGNKITVYFEYCSFTGGVAEVNIHLNHCSISGYVGDGMNPLHNFYVNNTFIYDLLPYANQNGVHIDGFQIYGRQDYEGGNIRIENTRFEIPSIHHEGAGSYVNACVMFQLEYGNVNNCIFQDLICNGGGKWFPIYLTKGKPAGKWEQKNLTLKNVKISDNFGTIFYTSNYDENAVVENVEHFNELYVTSVFVDNANKLHVIVTNDGHLDKIMKVITDIGSYEFNIPHCPSNWALEGEIDTKVNPKESLVDINGRNYTTYRYKDMPFDIDCIIDKVPLYGIKIYD